MKPLELAQRLRVLADLLEESEEFTAEASLFASVGNSTFGLNYRMREAQEVTIQLDVARGNTRTTHHLTIPLGAAYDRR